MPNQCVHCSEIYGDGSSDVLTGCSKCGSRFFFYLSEEKLKKIQGEKEENLTIDLSASEKKQVEKDVREIAGIQEEDTPVILDFESVKIIKPGKYLLDIAKLLSGKKPFVYKLEDGKYIIDIASNVNGVGKEI